MVFSTLRTVRNEEEPITSRNRLSSSHRRSLDSTAGCCCWKTAARVQSRNRRHYFGPQQPSSANSIDHEIPLLSTTRVSVGAARSSTSLRPRCWKRGCSRGGIRNCCPAQHLKSCNEAHQALCNNAAFSLAQQLVLAAPTKQLIFLVCRVLKQYAHRLT